MGSVGALYRYFTLPDLRMSDLSLESLLEVVSILPGPPEGDGIILHHKLSSGAGNLQPVGARLICNGSDICSDMAVRILHQGIHIILNFDVPVFSVIYFRLYPAWHSADPLPKVQVVGILVHQKAPPFPSPCGSPV